jgi:hypothetical protein
VSVIIAYYNKTLLVAGLLHVAFAQSFHDFVIVVDAVSTDGGTEIVEGIRDQRLRLVRQVDTDAVVALRK